MDTMGRIHGTGTYDHSTRKWKVRTKEISASATIAQLSDRYGVDLPNDERQTRPFWTRYLAELRTQHVLGQAADQLQAARIMYADPTNGHTLLGEPGELPHYSDFERNPNTGEVQQREHLPPEVVRIINEATQGNYAEVKALITKPPTLTESLRNEVTVYIDRKKTKGHKGHYDVRSALNLFLECRSRFETRPLSRPETGHLLLNIFSPQIPFTM